MEISVLHYMLGRVEIIVDNRTDWVTLMKNKKEYPSVRVGSESTVCVSLLSLWSDVAQPCSLGSTL